MSSHSSQPANPEEIELSGTDLDRAVEKGLYLLLEKVRPEDRQTLEEQLAEDKRFGINLRAFVRDALKKKGHKTVHEEGIEGQRSAFEDFLETLKEIEKEIKKANAHTGDTEYDDKNFITLVKRLGKEFDAMELNARDPRLVKAQELIASLLYKRLPGEEDSWRITQGSRYMISRILPSLSGTLTAVRNSQRAELEHIRDGILSATISGRRKFIRGVAAGVLVPKILEVAYNFFYGREQVSGVQKKLTITQIGPRQYQITAPRGHVIGQNLRVYMRRVGGEWENITEDIAVNGAYRVPAEIRIGTDIEFTVGTGADNEDLHINRTVAYQRINVQ